METIKNPTVAHLVYNRDFLLKFEHINKPDSRICALLAPFLSISQVSTPLNKVKKGNYQQHPKSPIDNKTKEVIPIPRIETSSPGTPKINFNSLLQENPNLLAPSNSSLQISPRSLSKFPKTPTSPRSPAISSPHSPRSHPSTPTSNSSPNFKPNQSSPSTPNNTNVPHKNTSYKNTPYRSGTKQGPSDGTIGMSHSSPPTMVVHSTITLQSPAARTRVVRPISPLDDFRIQQRQKQIDYGKKTVGYLRYRLFVPKDKRKPEHPRTPKTIQGCSKRSWDGQLKKWRRDLHLWDPDNMSAFKTLLDSDLVEMIVASNPDLAPIVTSIELRLEDPNFKLGHDSDGEEEEKKDEGDSDEEEYYEEKIPYVSQTTSKVARALFV